MKLRLFYIFAMSFAASLCCNAAMTGREWADKGLEYSKADNFPMAMRYFTKSMETAQREGDIHTVIVSTGYIANIYFNICDYTRSLQYLLKGYDMAVEQKDDKLIGSFLSNIVAAYCKMGDTAKAWQYYRALEDTPPGEDAAHFNYYLIYNRARIATAEGKYNEAIDYHEKALSIAMNGGGDTELVLFQYCEIGQLYLKMGEYAKAIEYGVKCIEPAKKGCEYDLLTSAYKMMADAYSLAGDTKNETEYRLNYLTLSDSLFNRNNIFSADKELVEYETRQTNEHIDSLNNVISRQTMTIIAVSVLSLLLIVLAIALFRYNRKLKMAHLTLVSKNQELQKAETDREKMLEQLLDKGKNADEMGKNSVGIDKEQANALLKKIMKVMGDISVIANPDFNLNSLADAVGSNTKYVSWIINDTYNKNFKTLLNEHRIREACKRLLDHERYGNMTIQAIYEEVGYTNAVSFIRAFKKVNGMTPSEYQKITEQNNYNEDTP